MKLEDLIKKIKKDPSPYDYKSLTDPWTDEQLSQIMIGEITDRVSDLAVELQRTEYAIILKYLEVRGELDGEVALDVLIVPDGDVNDVHSTPHTLDDFTHKDVTFIYANEGDVVKVNVRLLVDFPSDAEVFLFHTAGAVDHMIGAAPRQNNDTYASVTAKIVRKGHTRLGTMITGIRKPVTVIVE